MAVFSKAFAVMVFGLLIVMMPFHLAG